jgi:hypothetical protein
METYFFMVKIFDYIISKSLNVVVKYYIFFIGIYTIFLFTSVLSHDLSIMFNFICLTLSIITLIYINYIDTNFNVKYPLIYKALTLISIVVIIYSSFFITKFIIEFVKEYLAKMMTGRPTGSEGSAGPSGSGGSAGPSGSGGPGGPSGSGGPGGPKGPDNSTSSPSESKEERTKRLKKEARERYKARHPDRVKASVKKLNQKNRELKNK